MRKKYSDTLPTLKELFPDWKDEDLIFALEDSNGELEDAIVRITEGSSLNDLQYLLRFYCLPRLALY